LETGNRVPEIKLEKNPGTLFLYTVLSGPTKWNSNKLYFSKMKILEKVCYRKLKSSIRKRINYP